MDSEREEPGAGDPGLGAAPQVRGKQRMKAGIRAALFGDMDTETSSESVPAEGEVPERLGRFRILGELGRGGMGEVYSAYDPELDRKVAIKLLRRDVVDTGSHSEGPSRLQREAQAMARVNHPNVATVHEVATFEQRLYVAMEFIDGQTLRQWMTREEPSTPQILATFVQAGRGLAAAHDAGLVHRDFKPDNVLLGKDGRARVVDFGLARAAGGRAAPVRSPEVYADTDPLVTPLTRTGAVMGTPAYMSPEQHAGRAADARSDQFSFCLALWEALMGQRPFAGKTFAEVATNVTEGNLREPVPGRDVSGRIVAALQRGLSVAAEDRFEDMHELLRALEPPSRKRLWLVLGAGAATAALGATWVAARETADAVDACAKVDRQLDGIWDEPRRAAAKTTVLSSGHPHAEESWDSIQRHLDAYADLWLQASREVCAASQLSSADAETYARRQRCLDSRRAELDAMVGVFERADPAVVMVAVKASVSLSDVRDCSDERRLGAWRVPRQPEAQRELADVRAKIAAAKVRGLLAQYDDAVDMAREAAARGRHLDDPATEAAALLIQGQYLERSGAFEQSESILSNAVQRADVAEAYETKVKALTILVYIVGTNPERWPEAQALASEARTVLQVLGSDPLLAAELDLNLGGGARRSGETERARELFQASFDGFREHAGPQHINTAHAESNLGLVLSYLGRFEEAQRHLESSRDALQTSLGATHPSVGTAWNVLGSNDLLQERYEDAVADYERALAIQSQNFPDGHRSVMLVHYNLGLSHYNLRRYAEAVDHLEAGLEVRAKLEGSAKGSRQSWTDLLLKAQVAGGRLAAARATAEEALSDPKFEPGAEFLVRAAISYLPTDTARARSLAERVGDDSPDKQKVRARGVLALLDTLDQLSGG